MPQSLPETTMGIRQSLGFLYAVVSFGFSQIFLNLVQAHPPAFPCSPAFVAWTLCWIQVLPVLFLLTLDRIVSRGGASAVFRAWRALLCTLLALSLLKQLQVFHEAFFLRWLGFLPAPVLYPLTAALVPIAFLKWKRAAAMLQLYLSYAGICALALPVIFAWSIYSISRADGPAPPSKSVACNKPSLSIYMVVFDELSLNVLLKDGLVDQENFPNFAALASDSIWFRKATTNHWSTIDSIPTIMTGKIRPTPADRTLTEQLAQEYESTVLLTEIEVENWLRYRQQDRGIDHYFGKVHFMDTNPLSTGAFIGYRLWGFFTFENPQSILFDDPEYHVTRSQEEGRFLSLIRPGGPQFVLWHCSVPHSPFLYDANGKRHHRSPDFFPLKREYRPAMFAEIMETYRDQVRYADRVLGVILERLKSEGVYGDSILVVTSDHGVRVWGDLFNHVDLIARVPVFMRIPGKVPGISDLNVQLCDLAPTLLQSLGCPAAPGAMDGVPAFAGSRPVRTPEVHFYPGEVAFRLDAAQNAWLPFSTGGSGTAAVTQNVSTPKRGFFATQVIDDAMAAREEGGDFLAIYLAKHFPEKVSAADAAGLRGVLQSLDRAPDTPAVQFKRGMFNFFLALTETQLLADGEALNPAEINGHWNQATERMQKAGDLQPWIGEELARLLLQADKDGNQQLNAQELVEMVRSRRPKE